MPIISLQRYNVKVNYGISITSLVYMETKELMIQQPILLLVSAKGIS